jgi:hypothetical protein
MAPDRGSFLRYKLHIYFKQLSSPLSSRIHSQIQQKSILLPNTGIVVIYLCSNPQVMRGDCDNPLLSVKYWMLFSLSQEVRKGVSPTI